MDERLSDLERAAAGGDPDARAALVAQRLRAGRITREQVELAADLGDSAAQRVVGPRTLVDRWTALLEERGRAPGEAAPVARVVAARAWARWALDELGPWRDEDPAGAARVDEALAALDRWLGCPCAAHRDEGLATARRVAQAGVFGARRVLLAVSALVMVEPGRAQLQAVLLDAHLLVAAQRAARAGARHPALAQGSEHQGRELALAQALAVGRAAVVAWALGDERGP